MTHHHLESGERRADMDMAALIVTGGPAGAIVAIAILAIAFVGIRAARPFFFGVGQPRDSPRLSSLVEAPLIPSE